MGTKQYRTRSEMSWHLFIIGAWVLAAYLGVVKNISLTQLVFAFIAIAAASTATFYAKSRDAFHPHVFVTAYLTFAILFPLAYVLLTVTPIGPFTPQSTTPQTYIVMTLAVGSWLLAGHIYALFTSAWPQPDQENHQIRPPETPATLITLETLGRIALLASIPIKAYQAIISGGVTYGANQVTYSITGLLATVGAGAATLGVLALVIGRTGREKAPLSKVDVALLVTSLGISLLALGSRNDVIDPILIVAWAMWATKRIRISSVILGAIAFAAVSNFIAYRRSAGPAPSELGFIPRLFLDTTSPIYITNELVLLSKAGFEPIGGSTYLQTLLYFPPGPISRALFGNDLETAAYVYRKLIGFDNPNMGFGFSFPSEAYLNFGLIGVIILTMCLSAITLYAYRRSQRVGSVASTSFYLLLVSTMPYGYRSDSLTHLKLVTYPLAGLLIVLVLSRSLGGRKLPESVSQRIPANVKNRDKRKV